MATMFRREKDEGLAVFNASNTFAGSTGKWSRIDDIASTVALRDQLVHCSVLSKGRLQLACRAVRHAHWQLLNAARWARAMWKLESTPKRFLEATSARWAQGWMQKELIESCKLPSEELTSFRARHSLSHVFSAKGHKGTDRAWSRASQRPPRPQEAAR